MTAIRSQHSRAFEVLALTRRQKLLEAMAVGHLHDAYWTLVGQVRGLDEALALSEQADFQINGEEPDAG